ncbi:Hypothetical protein I595_442 [Croceitalea dokdonensis DOKDO 023]|uniref:Uncharacterized protein n=1 Tax=Croceitalea dokdonensis DOKDO 023 TaxID=1300341 RepID=A0A0P7B4B0_9FLAO|nr:Hypothetical protein I595_442 [Croceitalea dokdonensis DOKDO 023]
MLALAALVKNTFKLLNGPFLRYQKLGYNFWAHNKKVLKKGLCLPVPWSVRGLCNAYQS